MAMRTFWITILFLLSTQITVAQEQFENVAKARGLFYTYGIGTPSGGLSTVDFNGDGLDDITLASGPGKPVVFLRNKGDAFFEELDIQLQNDPGQSMQVVWVDYDNDGDKDLFVSSRDSQNRFYRNDGNLQFTEVTEQVGILREFVPTYGAAFADYDRDGFLDLYFTDRRQLAYGGGISNHLFRNNGDGTFSETTLYANVADSSKAPHCAYFFDYDNDGWEDLYVAQDKKIGNVMFRNTGDGRFLDTSDKSKSALKINAMSVTTGDYDNNGFLDVYITNTPEGNKLLRNDGRGIFTEVANNTGTGFFNVGWGAQFADFDNDGFEDLYVSGERTGADRASSAYYMNKGDGTFTIKTLAEDTVTSYANAFGDFNNDGYPDIVVNNPEPYNINVWENIAGNNKYLKIQLEGIISNRDAIGTRIEMYVNEQRFLRYTTCGSAFLGQNSGTKIFGIGSAPVADSILVKWPSGHIDKLYNVEANQTIQLTEGEATPIIADMEQSGSLVLCQGDSLKLNTTIYGRNITYEWSNGTSTPQIYVKEAGKYAVRITLNELNEQFTSDSVEVIINNDQKPDINITKQDISCFGMVDGAIQIEASTALEYAVEWDHGVVGNNLNELAAGIYSFRLSGTGICQINDVVVIHEPDSLGLVVEEHVFPSGTNLLLRASGGEEPYDYLWPHSGETYSEVFIDRTGDYMVEVRDDNNCYIEEEIAVFVENDITALPEIVTASRPYPNPTTGLINFDIRYNKRPLEMAMVSDIYGHQVKVLPVENTGRIDLQNLPNGVYFVELFNKHGKTKPYKIIKH
jgi:hypothetical protein